MIELQFEFGKSNRAAGGKSCSPVDSPKSSRLKVKSDHLFSGIGVKMQPPSKKRRTEPTPVEEITFDSSSRQEYLTGFHKRKLQRAKHAQEIAEKKARAEKIEERRKVRQFHPRHEVFTNEF